MTTIIKLTKTFHNLGTFCDASILGSYKDEAEAKKAIKKDVKKITSEWEDFDMPEIELEEFTDSYTNKGFRFNDSETGELAYADMEWIYLVAK